VLTGTTEYQALATGYPVGQRFHSAPVVRLADAKPMQLGHVHKADGRWRLYAFADKESGPQLRKLLDYLENDPASPIARFSSSGADIDSVFDLRAVFQENHRDFTIEDVPDILRPTHGKFGLNNYEKVFTPDYKSGEDIFEMRGINRDKGALVIVRPDQYVAQVLPLDKPEAIGAFFEGFMIEQR
jgi:phenol 2-monooxygenase